MKKVFLPILGLLLIVGCEKEQNTPLTTESDTTLDFRSKKDKIDVCHYSEEDGSWHVINISENAWPAHAGHGDVQLIDTDGDGWVTSENECGVPVDCDDTDAELTDNCTTSCVEGEVEIDFNGPLFVAPADEPGFYTWQQAKDQCDLKDTEGCDWFLPSRDELNALFIARNTIGGFVQSGNKRDAYWSSTEVDDVAAIQLFDEVGSRTFDRKTDVNRCRCVRR